MSEQTKTQLPPGLSLKVDDLVDDTPTTHSGVRYVTWSKRHQMYHVLIPIDGKRVSFGWYHSVEDAIKGTNVKLEQMREYKHGMVKASDHPVEPKNQD